MVVVFPFRHERPRRLVALAIAVLRGPFVSYDPEDIVRKAYPNFKFKKIGYGEKIGKPNVIELDSLSESAPCPVCGKISTTLHDTYPRTFQDYNPWLGALLVRAGVHRFTCQNPDCPCKTFAEPASFAPRYKRFTYRALQVALEECINGSFRSGEESLVRRNIKIGRMTLTRLLTSIDIVCNFAIYEIGVDDVANRRGISYYTVIYDTITHKPVALLDGRDGSALCEWLKQHPEVKEIRRDRASAYSAAALTALESCEQFADKFHIFKNENDALKDFFYENCDIKDIYVRIAEKDGVRSTELLRVPPQKIQKLRSIDLNSIPDNKYDCSPPRNKDGTLIEFNYSTYCISDKRENEIYNNRLMAQETARKVRIKCREIKENGGEIKYASIAHELGTTSYYVKKYSNMSDEEIDKMTAPVRRNTRGPVCEYIYMIYKMMLDGLDNKTIFYMIKFKSDYSGTDSALANYINAVGKNNFFLSDTFSLLYCMEEELPDDIIHYTRTDVLRLALTVNPETKKDQILASVFDDLKERYSIIKTVQACARDFYKVMNDGNPDSIFSFIEKYEDIIPSFCNGLVKDIDAVQNAIRTGKTSGYVEGCNTAFKLVKRIGNGRYTRETLYKKFFLFLCRKDPEFDTLEIVETRRCNVRN